MFRQRWPGFRSQDGTSHSFGDLRVQETEASGFIHAPKWFSTAGKQDGGRTQGWSAAVC